MLTKITSAATCRAMRQDRTLHATVDQHATSCQQIFGQLRIAQSLQPQEKNRKIRNKALQIICNVKGIRGTKN